MSGLGNDYDKNYLILIGIAVFLIIGLIGVIFF